MAFSPKSVIQILWSRHRPSDGDMGRRNPGRVRPSGNRIQVGVSFEAVSSLRAEPVLRALLTERVSPWRMSDHSIAAVCRGSRGIRRHSGRRNGRKFRCRRRPHLRQQGPGRRSPAGCDVPADDERERCDPRPPMDVYDPGCLQT